MNPIDIYDTMPNAQRRYLRNYGWNFTRKACKTAVEGMKKKDGSKVQFLEKEAVMELLRKQGVTLEHDNGYNGTYAYHMALADFYGKSLEDDKHLCVHVKCIIDDPDNEGGNMMRKWYADCVNKGIVVDWDELTD